MRIDNQQQQNKGVMDLMPQTGAVEEKNGIQRVVKNLQELRLFRQKRLLI